MGKGGESFVTDGAKRSYKLSNLDDDALRKWAKAYGLKEADAGKRDQLLELLVNAKELILLSVLSHAICFPTYLPTFHVPPSSGLCYPRTPTPTVSSTRTDRRTCPLSHPPSP